MKHSCRTSRARTRRWPHALFATLLCFSLGLSLSLTTASARAQGNATLAEALFDDGHRLFDAGKYEQACAKFAESQKLDPATGTLLNLAICYEKAGRLATAWATWREAASSARSANQPDREQHAREMAGKLEGKLARLTIEVKGGTNLPQGFTVMQDGAVQPAAAWGTSLPVDAGPHRLEASAPGFITWVSDLQIKDGQSLTVSVPILALQGTVAPVPPPEESQEEPEEPAEEPEEADEQEPEPKEESSAAEESKPKNKLKVWGIVMTSVGGSVLGVGAIFGIRALALNGSSKDHCDPDDPNLCDSTGTSQRESAMTSANIANVMIGVGAAAAATGVVFLIIAPKKKDTAVSFSPTRGGGHLFLSGAF